MAKAITTSSHCAVNKDGRAFTGTREDIVRSVCRFWIDDNRELFFQFSQYPVEQRISYSDEYTLGEMHKDAVATLYSLLPQYGYQLFVKAGF